MKFHKLIFCSLTVMFGLFFESSFCQTQDSADNDKANVKATSENRSDLFFALECALQNNKDIIAAQKGLKATHEKHNLASAGFRPTVNANLGYSYGKEDDWKWETNKNKVTYNKSTKEAGITIKQNIFKGGADLGTFNEAKASIKAAWSDYEAAKQKILCDVATLYFEILAKQKEIQHIKSLLEVRASSLEVVTEMEQTGAEKYVSVMQAKAYYAETEAQLAKAEAELKTLSAQFVEYTGIPVPTNLIAPSKLFDTDMKESQARDIALKQNPEIIASIDKMKAAKEAIKKPNSSLYPSIDVVYGYSHALNSAREKTAVRNKRDHSISVNMSIPIYDAGVGRAQSREYSELAVKAAVEKEKTVEKIVAELAKVWATLESAKRNIISANTAVEARQLALHDTEEEYKAGIKIMNDVLDAQQKLFEAQTSEVQAQKNFFLSQCNALALLGRMTPKYLKLKVTDFDYKKHMDMIKNQF